MEPLSRRAFLPLLGATALLTACRPGRLASRSVADLFVARDFTAPGSFTEGVEGPAVDAEGRIYAVNCARQGTIGRVDAEGACEVFVDLPAGSIGNGIRFRSDGSLMVADYTGHNVLRIDPATRRVETFAHEPRMSQPNDLAIGADDTLYASDPDWMAGTGRLWRVDAGGRVTLLEEGMGTTNGIEVSPDERTLYVNESVQRTIWAYDLGPGGAVSNKRLLHRFADHGLDGMRCDAAGNLYVARYDRGTVAVISAAGALVREVALPGRKPTNVAFGGPDGRTVYVTLADRGNIAAFRADREGREWQLLRKRPGRA